MAIVLWLVRIGAIALILVGSVRSVASDRLSGAQWRDLVVFGVSQGSMYALIALGYTMVYGVLRFINFAHGEVFMTGAMTSFIVAGGLAQTPLWIEAPVIALLLVLLCSMAVSVGVAVTLERVAYRPLRGAPRLIPLITSIGASFFLQYLVRGLVGPGTLAFPEMAVLKGFAEIAGLRILKTQLIVIAASLLMMVALYYFVEKTKTGRAIRAVAEDAEIAALMGINVNATIVKVFAVGGAMAGVAGALWGLVFPSLNFFSGFFPGIKAFTSAVLGGIGNIVGAMVGGVSLGIFENVGPSLVLGGFEIPAFNQLRDVVAFLALILVLVFRPQGLLGERLARERG